MTFMDSNWVKSIVSLIERCSTELPRDVLNALKQALDKEPPSSSGRYVLENILENINIAQNRVQPICQDTGTVIFFVNGPSCFNWMDFKQSALEAVKIATEMGLLRSNCINPIVGKPSPTNTGEGNPVFYFHFWEEQTIQVYLILKGGGSENVSIQYSLPYEALNAERDLEGVRRVILDAVYRAQGKGCPPGVLGVCIGGDRAAGYEHAKRQLLRLLHDQNPIPELKNLEERVLSDANFLGIGPGGVGGATTLLGVKIGFLHHVPASYFVTVAYMCWAYRRQGIQIDKDGKILDWLY